jgi:hypothetical protein
LTSVYSSNYYGKGQASYCCGNNTILIGLPSNVSLRNRQLITFLVSET